YFITSLSYHVVLEKMAWYDAQQYCREIYTDLVSIKDQEQNEEVKLKGKNSIMSFWIGLLCDDWEWADGGLSAYRNWGGDNSQPFSCVELVKEEWSPAECNDPAYALCYSMQSRLRTFHIIGTENLTQSEAQAACKRNYTDLVTVYNKEENTVLANLTKTVYPSTAWIGLYRKHPSYKWSNGDAVTFKNMIENLVTQMCCVMKADGAWDWYQCTAANNFMCYKQGMYHSYHLVLEKMTWYDAQRYCMENYTDLVSIRNQKQNEEVMLKGEKSSTPFWIGLLCDDWEWADGGLSGYKNWGGDNSQSFSCVELVKEEWSPAKCNDPAYALCYSMLRIHLPSPQATPNSKQVHETGLNQPTSWSPGA
ncbi:hypothetical protein P4O66_014134, partial [Electrophorus voltai]